jgi:dimethylargininase
MYTTAITRKPSENFADGITTSDLGKPDFELMLSQHTVYVDRLKKLGLEVIVLEALHDYPDAHFVEDTAVVVPEIAIITRPGASGRRGEEVSIENELTKYKKIEKIYAPGKVDGGDILIINKEVFIGISERTNLDGVKQLSDILKKFGYKSKNIQVYKGLHLKSDVNYIGRNTLIVTENYFGNEAFKKYDKICVGANEAYAANSLLINNKLIIPKGFPETKSNLNYAGFNIIELDMSESQKMDGGLTCLSLRF